MATEPVPAGPRVLALEIPLEPTAGDAFTYISSHANAALAIAALREGLSPDAAIVAPLTDLHASPMYHAARTSLERDLFLTEADVTLTASDRKRRRTFAYDTFAARLYLAGMLSTHELLTESEAA